MLKESAKTTGELICKFADEGLELKATHQELWNETLKIIKSKIGSQRFNTWFKYTELNSSEGEKAEIGVPNLFVQEWLEENYVDIVKDSLEEISGQRPEIKFTITGSLFQKMRADQEADGEVEIELSRSPSRSETQEVERKPKKERRYESSRKSFKLEEFIVGPCNRLAYATAMEVAKNPDVPFNPLFIHGDVGLGKSHLLIGVANYIRRHSRDRYCLYIPAEKFMNQYVSAMRNRRLDEFRNNYRKVDVLLIDDVHYLSNKSGFQQEFLYTYNALEDLDKQIVIASNSHPRELPEIKDGLINRFLSGMIAQLNKPDFNTRIEILKSKTIKKQKRVAEEVLEFIAENFDNNVRELEGALTSVIAQADLLRKKIDLVLAQEVLIGLRPERSTYKKITIQGIERAVIEHFGVSRNDLRSKKKVKSVVFPRQICMYLARTHTDCSCHEIGNYFGGKNHATVICAERRIEELIKSDEEVNELVDQLIQIVTKQHT